MTTRSLSRIVLAIPTMLFAALFGTVVVYVLGMRSKSPSVRRGARTFHHAVGNRL